MKKRMFKEKKSTFNRGKFKTNSLGIGIYQTSMKGLEDRVHWLEYIEKRGCSEPSHFVVAQIGIVFTRYIKNKKTESG